MKPKAGFLSLAEELRLYILSFLSCRDILRCTSVCKALRQTYLSSSELQYIVELNGQRLLPVPNTDDHTPTSERLQLLRDRAHVWFKVDFHSSETVFIPDVSDYVDQFVADGHLYLWDAHEDKAAIIPILPKPSQQRIERNWSPGTLCSVPNSTNLDVFMNPAQNLIAVVYRIVDDERLYIQLRALYSDSDHSQAAGRTLFPSGLPGYDNEWINATLKGCGRHIALQCWLMVEADALGDYSKCVWQLQIWEWQHSTTSSSTLSGILLNPVVDPTDFCFLGNDRLLVVADDLKIYSIEDMSRAPQLLACFLSPVPLRNIRCLLPMDNIGHSSQMQAQRTMYTSDPTNRLLCLTVSGLVFIISTRIFFDLHGMPAAVTPIPWNQWGPSNARVFGRPSYYNVHVSGNRLLLQSLQVQRTALDFEHYIFQMLDFSPLAAMNRRGLGRLVTEPYTVDISDCTGRPGESLTTSLPYVEVESDRMFIMFEDTLIDRDRIYLLDWEPEVEGSTPPTYLATRSSRVEVIDF
ncbi:hypothetical protein DEU56DRAFT_95585 [Suillus clintonianus]|uniref:uncharacterized protein n=1 Tax=Suillus clintonianus TaxID=1904413 RepID=UPI001B881066|nr:uncharacterized protein DEU56DRAFT_95585 [Suillus clintonianus]KAG2121430.1 hypothetical protein DEU56DRAFT_95585 [Suillus clintonianus]